MARRQCGVDSRTRSTLDAKTLKIAPRCCARGCKWRRNILMAFPPSSLSCMTRLPFFWPLCKLWRASELAGRFAGSTSDGSLEDEDQPRSLKGPLSPVYSACGLTDAQLLTWLLVTGSHNQVLMFVKSAAITYPWTPFSPRPRLYSGESSVAHWPTTGC